MVKQLFSSPEIWQIYVELPQNPLKNLNSYVIRSDGETLLIDTGFRRPECQAALWEGIRELSLDLSHTSIFLTHLHSDHIGLVHDFVERGCTVYMNAVDHDYFCRSKSGKIWPYMERLFVEEGFPEDEVPLQQTENQGRRYAPERAFPAVTVRDCDVLSVGAVEIQCIHVPGHTPGNTVLHLPREEILFSGDHILFDITPNISVWKDVPHSLADYLASLERIRALPIQRTFPAHRAEHEDVYTRIEELIHHHQERLEEVWQAVTQNPGATAYQIAGKIRWSARNQVWEHFPPHQKWFAMGETLAHLYWLTDAGRLVRRETPGGVGYECSNSRLQ